MRFLLTKANSMEDPKKSMPSRTFSAKYILQGEVRRVSSVATQGEYFKEILHSKISYRYITLCLLLSTIQLWKVTPC